jgi:hypothetical protein
MSKSSKSVVLVVTISALFLVLFQNFMGVDLPTSSSQYAFSSFESNSILWPVNQIGDNAVGTSYSSQFFANASNPNLYLTARLTRVMPISKVILGARMHQGKPLAFPKLYDIYLLDHVDSSKWNLIGSFGNQPDELGIAAIDLGSFYFSQAIKVVPRLLGQDNFNNSYLQISELKVTGPTVYRFPTAQVSGVSASLSIDGNDLSFNEFYKGSVEQNPSSISFVGSMRAEQLVSKLYMKAHVSAGKVIGFPTKYIIEYTNARLAGKFVSIGEFMNQPDARGNIVVDLKRPKLITSLRITPTHFGPGDVAGQYSFRIAEINPIGPSINRMSTVFSNDIQLAGTNAIDGSKRTYYSSNPFPLPSDPTQPVINNRGTMIAFWTPGLEPVSRVLIHARMANGVAYGFPKTYSVHVSSPEADRWILVGTFSKQPNADGFVSLNLGKMHLTHGVSITPIELGRDPLNQPIFQLAEVNTISASLGKGSLGATSLFHSLSLNAGESIRNGSAELKLQSDGNLVVYSRAANKIVWSTGTSGRACSVGCKVEFRNGFLTLTQNGKIYWSTANAGPGNLLHFTRRFPFVSISYHSDGVWPSLRDGERMSLNADGKGSFVYNGSDGRLSQQYTHADGVTPFLTWRSENASTSCLGKCRAVFQPDGKVKLYRNGGLYYLGQGFIM